MSGDADPDEEVSLSLLQVDEFKTRRCTHAVSLAHGSEGFGACWGEEKARDLLAAAGFTSVEVSRVEGDPLNVDYVCRP